MTLTAHAVVSAARFARDGEAVAADEALLGNPARLRDWLVGRRITHAEVDAVTAQRLLTLYWPAGTALRELTVRGGPVTTPAGLPFDVVTDGAPGSDDHDPFGLTDTQQAYWVGRGDAVELGGVGCHGYWEWDSDDLDVERLRCAWRRVLDRHPMLRAVVCPDGTQRVLADPPDHQIPVLDLRGCTAAQADAVAQRLRAELSHQVLPADRYPLWDVRLTLLPDGRTRLHLGLDLLIIDAWSYFQVLMPDLISYYADPDAALEPIGLTFRDYVLATDPDLPAVAGSAEHERAREYWLSRLDDLPPAPDLPRAQPGPAVTSGFTRREHSLPAGSWSAVKDRAAASGLTPAGLVVAAFAEVLRTWSTTDRFTINFPLFNRQPVHPDVDRLVGDFTTTSLLAVEKVDGTFVERARSIQQRLWTDLEHRQFSGVRVGRELARRAGGAVRASFPVVVTSLLGQPPRHFTTALGRNVFTSTQTPQVSLDFQVMEVEGELRYSWDSVDELFCPGLVGDMFGAYRSLLDRLVADASAWDAEHFQLVPPPQLRVRAEVNATDAPIPDVLLHWPVQWYAQRTPDAVALVGGGVRLRYDDLAARVNRLGRRLRELGARPNTLVAIVLTKGWEQVLAAHAVLASGAAYLPVDPCLPPERLRYLLLDGAVGLTLTSDDLDGRLDWPPGVRRVRVDADLSGVSAEPLPAAQRPTDLAYVIYTSGSTGQPKGVMVDHRGAANTIADINGRFGVGRADSCLAVTALHHDLSVYDVFGMFAAGGKVVVPDAGDPPDPAHWAELVATEGVTFWNSVPALLEMLVNHLEGGRGRLDALRLAILAGDWIPVGLPDRVRALGDAGLRVIGSGGPTESCVWSIIHPIGEVDPALPSIPYGRPMTNQRYHVLDGRRLPRPNWVPGELHIESNVGLALGYWRDPARTAAKFSVEGGSRRYASGDIGRYLPDGTIEILGRDDFQVKIAGHRIELGEIEAALVRHPAVDRAVVVATGPPRELRRLLAFVTARGPVEPDALRRLAAETLPAHMVPAAVTVLDAFPLTPNGKVDRVKLACLRPATPATGRAATTPLEQVLAALWSELLDVPDIGPDGNFFALGGNSITATRLVAAIRELLAVDVTLRAVFDAPTLAEQAAALASPQASTLAETLLRLTPEDVDRLAASPALGEP